MWLAVDFAYKCYIVQQGMYLKQCTSTGVVPNGVDTVVIAVVGDAVVVVLVFVGIVAKATVGEQILFTSFRFIFACESIIFGRTAVAL